MPAKKYPRIEPLNPDDDNVLRQAQSQGQVRPDGPGDATAPIEPKERDRARARSTERKPPVKARTKPAAKPARSRR